MLFINSCIGDANLTSNNEQPCPDDMIVFNCNVSGVDITWQVHSDEDSQVARFFIDDSTMANVPEEQSGFAATLRSRTSITDSSSTLTTTASVQINGYTVVCADAAMVIGRKTIQLSSEFTFSKEYMIIIITNVFFILYYILPMTHSCRPTFTARNNRCSFKSTEIC